MNHFPENRIMTLHPDGKKGVNILKDKYDLVKEAIIDIIAESGEISYKDLNDTAAKTLHGKLEGSIPWYVVTVKLDLEARNIITRIPETSPHRLKLVGA